MIPQRIKKFLYALLHPPLPMLILLPPAAAVGLVFVFLTDHTETAPAYAVYALSAYSLVIVLLCIVGNAKRIGRGCRTFIDRKAEKHPALRRYLTDADCRRGVALYQSAAVDLAYAVFRTVTGILYASLWFVLLAVYHLSLLLLRLYLILCRKKEVANDPAFAYNCYVKTAWFLFLLNIPMAAMAALTVLWNAGFSYPGYIIYVCAMYTFYTAATATIELVRRRKTADPLRRAANVIGFIAALMSVLGLQTAMLSQFSAAGATDGRTMNAVTGGILCGVVVTLATGMLIYGYRKKAELTCMIGENNDEQIGE